jgi:hypothetical protein
MISMISFASQMAKMIEATTTIQARTQQYKKKNQTAQ